MKHFFILLFLFTLGCKPKSVDPTVIIIDPDKKPVVTVTPAKFEAENTWIYTKMKSLYLWEDKMPAENKTDKNLEPEKYFATLINQNGQVDRVSYFKADRNDIFDYWTGKMKCYGFKYRKFKLTENSIGLAVSLVYKNSSAQKGGLWRGDIISKIDGNTITTANVESLLAKDQADFSVQNTENKVNILKLSKTNFEISPIQNAQIIELDKKKIGYMVYSQFLSNSESEMRGLFGNFKAQKIDEFILDLRFNQGGVTPNAEIVASLIVKNLNPASEMFHSSWNKEQTEKNIKESGQKAGIRYWTTESTNLGNLNRVYVLTSKSSASSSELVINSLRAYMEVITVGDNTFGKNLISLIVSDETNKFNFAIMPAYTYIYNAKGESNYGTKDGIIPNYRVEDYYIPYFPLGNINEPLLNKALSLIINKPVGDDLLKGWPVSTYIDGFHHQDTGNSFIK